jgi:hypothetical protein
MTSHNSQTTAASSGSRAIQAPESQLMKFLFEEAMLNAKGDSSQITLSFFFLARGSVEEKSTIGLPLSSPPAFREGSGRDRQFRMDDS